MPLQAQIADKLAIVRSMHFVNAGHTGMEIVTGFPVDTKPARPSFGSVVSRLTNASGNPMPPYVYLREHPRQHIDPGISAFLGTAHQPFTLEKGVAPQIALPAGVTLERFAERKALCHSFDSLGRDLDRGREMAAADAITARALEMILSPKTRAAFDLAREAPRVRDRYGSATALLQALRLVESGVSVVTVSLAWALHGDWDTHGNANGVKGESNFQALRQLLPKYDRGIHALVTDLHDRGLDKDVAVVVWGEFGRTPVINKFAGRDHWAAAGFALFAGGGFKTGQVIGSTDARGERPKDKPYTPANVLATLYHVLGIDPATTLPDHTCRPMYLLDEREPIRELI
jgi:hypothetical protein